MSRLSYDILQETHTVWKLLAYLVAELDATDSDIEQSVVESDLWKRMVEPHWGDFIGLLHRVPDGETRVDRSELDALTAELADVLHDWLVTLGFEFADTPEGNAFWIVDWSLLIETPTRSVCWARRTTDGHVRLCRGQESRP